MEFPATEFKRDRRELDGLSMACRACTRAMNREYRRKAREENPEKVKAESREKWARHRENFRNAAMVKASRAVEKSLEEARLGTALDGFNHTMSAFGGAKAFGLMIAETFMALPPSLGKLKNMIEYQKLALRLEDALKDTTPSGQLSEEELDTRLDALAEKIVRKQLAEKNIIDVPAAIEEMLTNGR